MSETPAKQSSQAPPPKGRNPIERIVVYGFMVVLLVLVGLEAKGRFAHKAAVEALQTLLKAREADPKLPEVTESDVKAILGSKEPSRTTNFEATKTFAASKKQEHYSWFTLNPLQKRELYVKYGRRGLKETGPVVVVSMSTDENESEPPEHIATQTPAQAGPNAIPPGGGPPMMPGGAGGPPGRGGPGGPPRAHDAEPSEKPADNKPADEKPADEKPADEKKPDAEGEKPAPQQ